MFNVILLKEAQLFPSVSKGSWAMSFLYPGDPLTFERKVRACWAKCV